MKLNILCLVILSVGLCGCGQLRFAPSEELKANALTHNKTAGMAAKMTIEQDSSETLKALTSLSAAQSRAFVADYGYPREMPDTDTVNDILSSDNYCLAENAFEISSQRPDVWGVTDGILDAAIAIAALAGGAGGMGVVRFLKQVRVKSKALREIVDFNEVFKKQNSDFCEAFKIAQKGQSLPTKAIVAQMKVTKE